MSIIAACTDHGIAFSITVPRHKVIVEAIEGIDEDHWVNITTGTTAAARSRAMCLYRDGPGDHADYVDVGQSD